MPKRKPPPAPKLWARMIAGRDWEIYPTDGKTLREIETLTVSAARELSDSVPVYWISFLSPVREITGDSRAIEAELKLVNPTVYYDTNTVSLFGSSSGSRAVVFEYQH
jgi:hypothetical protein